MLSPALAAVQSALNPLLMAAAAVAVVAVAVVAVVAALYWLGGRKPGRSAVATDADAAPGCDSGFAAEAAAAADTAQRSGAPPAAAWLPLAADLLVVDDSAVARAKLRRLFTASGYEVQLARDGVEALTLLQKGRYRMMITDLEMPKLNGVELICTCQTQAHTADMPILAITGHEDLQARLNECQEICGIYRKPWIDDDLASHVALLIGTPANRQAETVDT